jgi:hypothetical protein
MPFRTHTRMRAVVVATACATVAALAAAPLAAAATPTQAKPPRPALIFGGSATLQLDPALMAANGIVVEQPRLTVLASARIRYNIVDGKATLRFPLKGNIKTVGNAVLRQPATFTSLNFTDVTVGLTPAKSVLSADSGQDIGYGGQRQTLLRIAPTRAATVVKTSRLKMTLVPITLTATGATTFNALFGVGRPTPPFSIGQQIGTLTVTTRWYYPNPGGGRS